MSRNGFLPDQPAERWMSAGSLLQAGSAAGMVRVRTGFGDLLFGARSRSRTGSVSFLMMRRADSHEAIYQAPLYVQGRGALKRELVACLRTGGPTCSSRKAPGKRQNFPPRGQ